MVKESMSVEDMLILTRPPYDKCRETRFIVFTSHHNYKYGDNIKVSVLKDGNKLGARKVAIKVTEIKNKAIEMSSSKVFPKINKRPSFSGWKNRTIRRP